MSRAKALAAAAMAVIAFASSSCSKGDSGDARRAGSASERLPHTTLTLYLTNSDLHGERDDARRVLDQIEAEIENTLNVTLDIRWFNRSASNTQAGYADEVMKAIAAGGPLDAFAIGAPSVDTWYSPLKLAHMVDREELADITGLLRDVTPDLHKKYSRAELEAGMVDGKLYALPSLARLTHAPFTIVRRDYMNAFRIPEIKTLEDYGRYLSIVRANVPRGNPGLPMGVVIDALCGLYGYDVLDPNAMLVYRRDDPEMTVLPWEQVEEFQEIVDIISAWRAEGLFTSSSGRGASFISPWYVSRSQLASGKAASVIGSAEAAGGQTIDGMLYELNGLIKAKVGGDAELTAFRLYPQHVFQRMDPLGGAEVSAMAFYAQSPDVDRALRFLEWVQSEQEHYDLFMYGIEGEHFTVRRGKYELIADPDDDRTYFGWSGRRPFQNAELERYPQGAVRETPKERERLWSERSTWAAHLGFHPDYTAVKTHAAMRTRYFFMKVLLPLLWSPNPRSLDLKEVAEELSKNGTPEVVAEAQRQLDGWRQQRGR